MNFEDILKGFESDKEKSYPQWLKDWVKRIKELDHLIQNYGKKTN